MVANTLLIVFKYVIYTKTNNKTWSREKLGQIKYSYCDKFSLLYRAKYLSSTSTGG